MPIFHNQVVKYFNKPFDPMVLEQRGYCEALIIRKRKKCTQLPCLNSRLGTRLRIMRPTVLLPTAPILICKTGKLLIHGNINIQASIKCG